MSDEKKIHKRKIAIRYIILAACILVIAAVTVTTVFAVNDWFRNDVTIDTGDTNNPGTTPPDDTKDPVKPDEPDKPTVSETTFLSPVANLNVINVYDFGKDVSLGHWHFHEGIDVAAAAGSSVVACLDGTVENIVVDDRLDGTTVTLVHDNGLKTIYSYVNVKSGLKKGDKVKRGDTLGTVSEPTGAEFKHEAHLHFELEKDGKKADPAEYLDISEK